MDYDACFFLLQEVGSFGFGTPRNEGVGAGGMGKQEVANVQTYRCVIYILSSVILLYIFYFGSFARCCLLDFVNSNTFLNAFA